MYPIKYKLEYYISSRHKFFFYTYKRISLEYPEYSQIGGTLITFSKDSGNFFQLSQRGTCWIERGVEITESVKIRGNVRIYRPDWWKEDREFLIKNNIYIWPENMRENFLINEDIIISSQDEYDDYLIFRRMKYL